MVLNLFEYNNCKYIVDDFVLFVDLSDLCRYYACVCSWSVFLLGQSKIACDSDPLKLEEEELILKVGECLEARSLFLFSSFLFLIIVRVQYFLVLSNCLLDDFFPFL